MDPVFSLAIHSRALVSLPFRFFLINNLTVSPLLLLYLSCKHRQGYSAAFEQSFVCSEAAMSFPFFRQNDASWFALSLEVKFSRCLIKCHSALALTTSPKCSWSLNTFTNSVKVLAVLSWVRWVSYSHCYTHRPNSIMSPCNACHFHNSMVC